MSPEVEISTWTLETLQMREDGNICNKLWISNEVFNAKMEVTQILCHGVVLN